MFKYFEYRILHTMKIKEENITRLINAMFALMTTMKKGAEECCIHSSGKLNEKEFLIVNFVGKHQNVKMSDISEGISTPLSTLTSIIDKLVDKKYLSRYHSDEDRRVVKVALAKNGEEIYTTFISQKEDFAMKILSDYDDKSQEELISYIEKIPHSLNK
ncbi:MAG: MarR family transcriptional regulator [Flavobacteriales bacterium]|nr:MarR family transcriptional regulator [Flavobacteriales bacterium]